MIPGKYRRLLVCLVAAMLAGTARRAETAEAKLVESTRRKEELAEIVTRLRAIYVSDKYSLLTKLAEMRGDAIPALPAVMVLVRPQNEYTYQAIETIGAMGPGARAALPLLIEVLNDASLDSRDSAVGALIQIDLNDPRVRAGLFKAFSDSGGQRSSVNNAFIAIGPADREIVTEMIRFVRKVPPVGFDASPFMATRTTPSALYRQFFSKLDRDRRDAAPELVQLARDFSDNPAVLEFTLEALLRIDALPDEFIPVLISKLDEPSNEWGNDAWVFRLLEALGPRARAAVPVLEVKLRSGDLNAQIRAARVLGRVGLPEAKPAVPILEALVAPGGAATKSNAFNPFGTAPVFFDALIRLDPKSDVALRGMDAIFAMANPDADPMVDTRALLWRIGHNPTVQRDALLAIMRGKGGDDQERAAEWILRLSAEPLTRHAAIDWLVAEAAPTPTDGYNYREWAVETLLALPSSDRFDRSRLLPALRAAQERYGNPTMMRSMQSGYFDPGRRILILLTYALASSRPVPRAAAPLLADIAGSNSHALREAAAGRLRRVNGDYMLHRPLD